MESELERKRHLAAFRGMADRGVYRAKAIEIGLSALYGHGWAETLPLLAAGQHYADRIALTAQGDGTRLIAHIYTRYLGDLNGGQILKRLMAKSLQLDNEALSFFDFPDIADMDSFKAGYRAAIDRSADEIAAIGPVIEEAATAFMFNIQLSDAVQKAVTLTQNAAVPSAPYRAALPTAG
jgi:heme oxygenase